MPAVAPAGQHPASLAAQLGGSGAVAAPRPHRAFMRFKLAKNPTAAQLNPALLPETGRNQKRCIFAENCEFLEPKDWQASYMEPFAYGDNADRQTLHVPGK